MRLIHDGKTKRVYEHGGSLILRFRDTVLGHADGTPDPGGDFIVGKEKGKATIAASAAVKIFELLEREGIRTHFLRLRSGLEIEVQKTLAIPLEVIYRVFAFGSFLRRYGKLARPLARLDLIEFTLKSDELRDPLITEEAITKLGIAGKDEIKKMKQITTRIAKTLEKFLRSKGLELVDFKVEFGRKDKELLVIDAINADTMRVMDLRRKQVLGHRELAERLEK
jgi:phosphoribosylaminoimidazole-succinocarboxamide synthase